MVGAGGNHLVACTAGGKRLGEGKRLKLRAKELAAIVQQYRQLPREQRQPALPGSDSAQPPRRPVPQPPKNGLVIRGYCTYLRSGEDNEIERATQYYYKQNPNRWAAETQSDMLWLTESEWKSLVPENPRTGDQVEISEAIQQRFYSTVGIDYMEGSVNSLPLRDASMKLTVEQVTPEKVSMRLDGYGRMGKVLDDRSQTAGRTRGCEVRVLGFLRYNRKSAEFERFDLVGMGKAWGNKMSYTNRAIHLDEYPWTYGIACQLVTGDTPYDRVPPYNLLHYNAAGKYFAED